MGKRIDMTKVLKAFREDRRFREKLRLMSFLLSNTGRWEGTFTGVDTEFSECVRPEVLMRCQMEMESRQVYMYENNGMFWPGEGNMDSSAQE